MPPNAPGGSVAAVAHRVGTVPLVFVGAGVLVGVAVLWRSQARNAPAPAADQAAGAADVTPVTSTAPSYLVVGNNAPTGTGITDATSPDAPTDNLTWQRRAETQLIALGYDPILVDQALSLYLSGQALTQQQAAIVSIALAKFGPPPSPPPAPIVQAPAPDTGANGTPPVNGTPAPVIAPAPVEKMPAPIVTDPVYYVPGGPILGPILVPSQPALPIRESLIPRPATRQL